MVEISVTVRPRSGYNGPKKTKRVTVDTSDRVEEILSRLKLEKKGTRFFNSQGKELPHNSSLASNNVRDGDFLEACPAPKLSAVLSAVLRDLNEVEHVPEEDRNEARLRPLLDVDGAKSHLLDPFPERWSADDLKNRIIALATIKKIIQRQDRYEDQQVPYIDSLQALFDFVQTILQRASRGRGHNSILHVVKPTSKKDGKPTTCWVLLQQKLDQMNSIAANLGPGQHDIIEEFVKVDYARHNNGRSTPGSATPAYRGRSGGTPASTPGGRAKRARRNLQLQATTTTNSNPSCTGCGTAVADSICLDAGCPFHKQLLCLMCFTSNHPMTIRNHERVNLTDTRAKRVLKQLTPTVYIPEFASGPFAILTTLTEMSTERTDAEHSLSESRLKKLAQERCRSNLYDTQSRGGRNAFASAENLADKSFLRKEIIPGVHSGEAKYSLMPTGEALGKLCLAFERGLETALHARSMVRQRSLALSWTTATGRAASSATNSRLIIDTREDAEYSNRLVERLSDEHIDYERRELPSGDYLWSVGRSGSEQRVLPLLIERKSWSDLADSVMGRGQRRLDCVRVGSAEGNRCQGSCQLCRMKRSGCTKLMFIIEGPRCLGRDGEDKCSPSGCCKYCRELAQRHSAKVVQMELEKVLERLQFVHGFIIHFTNGFNETISSLITLDAILAKLPLSPTESRLTYQQFCTNSRSTSARANPTTSFAFSRGDCIVLPIEQFVRNIHDGKGPSSILQGSESSTSISESSSNDDLIILDDSAEEAQKKPAAASKESSKASSETTRGQQDCIVLDSDDSDSDDGDDGDDEIEWISSSRPIKKPRTHKPADGGDVVVLDDFPSAPSSSTSGLRKRARDGTKTKLVIIPGLLEYDTEYKNDTNKVWQSLYKMHVANHNLKDFENTAAEKLKSICMAEVNNQSSHLVPRVFIRFWALYLQIFNQDVRIHFVRESSGLDSLRSSWQGRQRTRTTSGSPSVSSEACNRLNTPSRRRLTFNDKLVDCMICNGAINDKHDEWKTLCSHIFHRGCLTSWLERSGCRKCPQCSVDGIGMPKKDDDLLAKVPTSSNRKRKAPPNDSTRPPRAPVAPISNRQPYISSTDADIREARLRRFQGGGSALQAPQTPAASASFSVTRGLSYSPRDDKWNCSACTLINDGSEMSCRVCETQRPGVTSNTYNTPCMPSRSSLSSASRQTSTNSNRSSNTRQIRCGACKQIGHNRASATSSNCPAFNDPEEVEMRRKKAEEAQKKARDLLEETKERESTLRDQQLIEERRNAELQRLLEENNRKTAEVNRLQAAETKRLKAAAARAEKRAKKLENNR